MNELDMNNDDDNNLSYLDYDEYELFSEDAEWSPVVMRAMTARLAADTATPLVVLTDFNNIYK